MMATTKAAKLEADLAALPKAHARKTRCIVGEAIADKTTGTVVTRFVDDLRYSAPGLASVLKKHGITLSATAIRNHRRGDACACVEAGN